MGYAFISYSTRNQQQADEMNRLLKMHGIRTWMAPGDIPPGSKYAQAINVAIKECSCVVLMLSREAQESVWVAKEIERAVNYRKPVFPVQLDNVVLNDEFELYISSNQVVIMRTVTETAPELGRLMASVERCTGRSDSAGLAGTPTTGNRTASPGTLNALEQALNRGRAAASYANDQSDDDTDVDDENFEFEDISVDLIDNNQIHLEFCNCEVEDGEVQLSFWVKNLTSGRVKLFGEDIKINGKTNNSKYKFDFFGDVSASDTGFCNMLLYDIKPQGVITVTGHIEVDDDGSNKLFRTPGFEIVVDFNTIEQSISIENTMRPGDPPVPPINTAVTEYSDVPFELFDNGKVKIEVDDFVELDEDADSEIQGICMGMQVHNRLSQKIQLYGKRIMVNGRPNSDVTFDYSGEIDANSQDLGCLILNNIRPEGLLTISGAFEIDNMQDEKLFDTTEFSLVVDFDRGLIKARIGDGAPLLGTGDMEDTVLKQSHTDADDDQDLSEEKDGQLYVFEQNYITVQFCGVYNEEGKVALRFWTYYILGDQPITVYVQNIEVDSRIVSAFEELTTMSEGDSGYYDVTLDDVNATGCIHITAFIEIDNEAATECLYQGKSFSIDVDFDHATYSARMK